MSAPGASRRRQEEPAEGHENEERWLLTYSDMVTLLMVLFIVMFSISQVDKEKYMALKTGLSGGFGAPVSMLSGAESMFERGEHLAPDPVNLSGEDAEKSENGNRADKESQPKVDPEHVAKLVKATSNAQVSKELKKLDKVRASLVAALRKKGIPHAATFRYDERGLVVTIASDNVLFKNAEADLQPHGKEILDTLAPTLTKIPNRISIDGHTNSIPISTDRYPSNWELSAARATGVLHYLLQHHRFDPDRISASAFADTRPLKPHSHKRAVVLNRRVEIVVVASLDDSAGRTLARLAEDAKSGKGNGSGEAKKAQAKKAQAKGSQAKGSS